MNHHYIEYMVRERRREEIEACNRMRMLRSAGYLDAGFLKRLSIAITRVIKMWRERILRPGKSPLRLFLRRSQMIDPKGGIA